MATKYAVATGNWSSTSTWSDTDGGPPGASVPADGDTVVVCSGVTLTVDVDLSSWTTGINGMTIRGGATPGMLAFKNDADGTYYLKVKSGTTIAGTIDGGNRGRLFMAAGTWDTPSDLPIGRRHVLERIGTSATQLINAQNIDPCLRCTEPTVKFVRTYGTKYTVVAVSPTNDTLDIGVAPPANGTPVRVRSSGELPGGLTADVTYYIQSVSGTSFKLAWRNSTRPIIDITSAGSGTIEVYTGYSAGSTTVNVLDDVTGDPCWSTASGSNEVMLINSTVPGGNRDTQTTTLVAITSSTITLANAVDSAQNPGSYLVLINRNVRLLSNTTSNAASAALLSFGTNNTTGYTLQAEFRATSDSYGTGIYGGMGHIIRGCFALVYVGCSAVTGATVYGVAVRCQMVCTGTVTGTVFHATAMAFGCRYVFAYSNGGTLSGTAYASEIAASTQTGILIDGVVNEAGWILTGTYGRFTGVAYHQLWGTTAAFVHISGEIYGGSALAYTTRSIIYFDGKYIGGVQFSYQASALYVNGEISYCDYGFNGGSAVLLSGAYLHDNGTDITGPEQVTGYGATLGSTTQVANYSTGPSTWQPGRYVVIYDVGIAGASQLGQIKAWMPGGTVVTEAAPGTPPVSLPYAYKMTGTSASYEVFLEFPLAAQADVPIAITIYEKCNEDPDNWDAIPRWEICDPAYAYGDAAGILASVNAKDDGGDDTNWHTITLEYTPTETRTLILRCRAKDASAYFHWMYEVQVGSGGGGVYPSEDYVHADAGGYGPTGTEYTPALSALANWCLISGITWPPLDAVDGGVQFGPVIGNEFEGTGVNAETIRSLLTIQPTQAILQTNGRITPTGLIAYQSCQTTVGIPVVDADGNPVDLTGRTLSMKFWDKDDPGTVIYELRSDGDSPKITISENQAIVEISATMTATRRVLQWRLFDPDQAIALADGWLDIKAGPPPD